jgi:4-amino-4-deoxy-L-arabinose transferase-like glycosyltransferase
MVLSSSGEHGSARGAILIRLAAIAIVPACLLFTQTNRSELLLCLPILLLGNITLVAMIAGLCAAIVGSVCILHIPSLGIDALPGALHNAYFGGFRSGDVILIAVAFAVPIFTIRGRLLANSSNDPIAASVLPGFAGPLRLALAVAWPMLPIVAVPFGLVSITPALVWGAGIALIQFTLWKEYGRAYPPIPTVEVPRIRGAARMRQLVRLAVVTIIVLIPFANKPFHIDDPAYLWSAQQIVEEPFDFYGFNMYMNGIRVPMHMEMQNPPLLAYFLAGVSLIAGWSEVPMHMLSIAFTLMAILGTYLLAQRFCVNAWAAALAVLSSPGFYVSATTVMCDIPMIAFYVWAAYCWLTGYDKPRHAFLFSSAILVVLSALTKYFGMTLIPLLFAFSVAQSGGLRLRQCYLLLPVAALAAYELWTRDIYGRGLLIGASEYARNVHSLDQGDRSPILLVGAMFAGGGLGTIVLTGMVCARSRTAAVLSLGMLTLTAAAAGLLFLLRSSINEIETLSVANVWLGALCAALSIMIVALPVIDFIRKPGPDSLLLGLWLIGSILFCIVANWSVTIRALLPAVVPLAILMVRQLEASQGPTLVRKHGWKLMVAAGCAFVIGVLFARGDAAFARYERAMARAISAVDMNTGTLRFDGRWGLEYYLRTYGGKTLVVDDVRVGDRVALPERANIEKLLPGREYEATHEVLIPRQGKYQTMFAGAGFYSSLFGPLPFAIGDAPADRYLLYDVLR